jgi:hypothetical protein
MERTMRSLLTFVAFCGVFAACEGGSAGFVPYVPGPGFTQELEISLELPETGEVAAGEWVDLSASRRSGPWVLRDTLATERPLCERISPATDEFEVSEKVSWRVEPPGQVSFGNARPPRLNRQIRFNSPGRYQVWATSEGCGEPFVSNRVEVVVR